MKRMKWAEENGPLLFMFFNEIGIISQLANSMFERNLPGDLTSSQFAVLNWFIRVDGEATPGRLATAFQVTPGAMTNTLKKLSAKGLISVEPDASSGRKKRVTITSKGRSLRLEAISSAFPMFKDFAEFYPVEKVEQQLVELKKIREYLDEFRYGKESQEGESTGNAEQ